MPKKKKCKLLYVGTPGRGESPGDCSNCHEVKLFLHASQENVMAWFLPWDKPLEHEFLDMWRKDFERITGGQIYSGKEIRNADRFKFATVHFEGRIGDMPLFGVFAPRMGPQTRWEDCQEMRAVMRGTSTLDTGYEFINLRNIYKDMASYMDIRITRKFGIHRCRQPWFKRTHILEAEPDLGDLKPYIKGGCNVNDPSIKGPNDYRSLCGVCDDFELELSHCYDQFLVYFLPEAPPFKNGLCVKYRDSLFSISGAKGLLMDKTFDHTKRTCFMTTNDDLGKYAAIFGVFERGMCDDDMEDIELMFNIIFNEHMRNAKTQEQAVNMYKAFVSQYDYRLYRKYELKKCGQKWEKRKAFLH